MRFFAAVLLLASLVAVGCGGDDAACEEGTQSLLILEPTDGQMFTMADDVDPAMGGVQNDIALLACKLSSELVDHGIRRGPGRLPRDPIARGLAIGLQAQRIAPGQPHQKGDRHDRGDVDQA